MTTEAGDDDVASADAFAGHAQVARLKLGFFTLLVVGLLAFVVVMHVLAIERWHWSGAGKEFTDVSLFLVAGTASCFAYAFLWGRVGERSWAATLRDDVVRVAHVLLSKSNAALPERMFFAEDGAELSADIALIPGYAAFWNERVRETETYRFKGESARVASYRIDCLLQERTGPLSLQFLLCDPMSSTHDGRVLAEVEITLQYLFDLVGLHPLLQRVEVGFIEAPMTYRCEICDTSCMVSYPDFRRDDAVYYAYGSSNPTYRAYRLWFQKELDFARDSGRLISMYRRSGLEQPWVERQRYDQDQDEDDGLDDIVKRVRQLDFEEAVRSRVKRLDHHRASLLA